jgi:ribosome-binding factor A
MAKQPLNLFVPHKAPSHRQQRVAQEVRFCLSQIFLRGDWPVRFDNQGDPIKAPASLTITDISISADLKQATVWVMPLGGEYIDEVKTFLDLMTGHLRKQLSNQLQLRAVPSLKFEIDKSIDKMSHIDELLKKI